MPNNNKSIDSYIESARKFKSPVSLDKARSLIEMSDLNKIVQHSFFTKKGVKIMTFSSAIIATLAILAVNFGIFNNTVQKTTNQQSLSKSSKINTNKDLLSEKIASQPDKSGISISTGNANSKEFNKNTKEILDNKIIGMNSIQLTNEEMADFGIIFDSIEVNGKFCPEIGYWQKETAKSAAYSIYSKERSVHKNEKLPSEHPIKYLKLKPDHITDYDGTRRLFTIHDSQKIDGLDEFMIFHNILSKLYKLDFNKDYIPENFPNDVNQKLVELTKLSSNFQSGIEGKVELGNQIDRKLNDVYQYFLKVSKLDSSEQKKMELTSADTGLSSVRIFYSENPPDSNEKTYIEQMAKMGIKVVFSKHRLSMKEYLKQNYGDLESKLTSFKKQIDNFIMVNKMVALELPYKNDPNHNGLIFWYNPEQALIDALPQRFRSNLAKEFKLLENTGAICGMKIEVEKPYLDIWRACSGAIENLRVFPNPVKDQLNIKFELKESRVMSFSIYELSGSKIKDLLENQKSEAGTNSFGFDLTELRKGMYLIVASSNVGENAVQRIIKE